MAEGSKNRGGARPGAGRKTKAEILGLAAMLDEVCSIEEQKEILRKLAQDAKSNDFGQRHKAREMLLAYKFGKPRESKDISIDFSSMSDAELDEFIGDR